MKKFPRELRHGSGVPMRLDASRLLLSFKEAVEKDAVEKFARKLKLELEPDGNTEKRPYTDVVNHTDRRYWVRDPERQTIDDQRFDRLVKELYEQFPVEFIGPVYQLSNSGEPGGLLCPLPNVLLVKLLTKLATKSLQTGDIATSASAKRYGIKEIEAKSKYLNGHRYYEISQPEERNAYELAAILSESGKGAYELKYENMPMISPLLATPGDTLFPQQWNMPQINAPNAWNISTGSASIVVAVLDSGCELLHPDLVANYASTGIDLGDMVSDGSPNSFGSSTGHGTSCAGIVAALYNNALGIAGLAGSCHILPIAFRNLTDVEVANGLNYAVGNGANVVSMSFGGSGGIGWDFNIMDPAILAAFSADLVLCAATGNGNDGISNLYPARHPLVLACGASDQIDNRKSPASPDGEGWGSNFGTNVHLSQTTGVSVVAPGVRIPTTDMQGAAGFDPGDYVLTFNGTSSATPHVAGLAALILSQYPALTNVQVRNIIERTAEKVGVVAYANASGFPNGTRNQEMGYGRINAFQSLDFADVLIKDWAGDDGTEPSSPPGGNFWDFADIVVRIFDDNVFNPSNPSQSKNVERGQDNYIYVQVTNNGPRDATNVLVNCRITPWVGVHFVYPQDWSLADAMHVQPTAITNVFASVPSGSTVMAKFMIVAADVEVLYGWQYINPWHPCLLASVTADNDYAFASLAFGGSALSQKVNNLAQRNLSVIDVLLFAGVMRAMAFPFAAGSRFDDEQQIALTIDKSRMGKATNVLLSLDDAGSAFPLVDFTPTAGKVEDPCGNGGMVFLEKTTIETSLGCCKGVLTIEKGSRFDCLPKRTVGVIDIKGGELIIRGGKRYVEIREQKTIVRLEKQAGQMYPLSVHFDVPPTATKGEDMQLVVSQQNGRGETVGGATAIYMIK